MVLLALRFCALGRPKGGSNPVGAAIKIKNGHYSARLGAANIFPENHAFRKGTAMSRDAPPCRRLQAALWIWPAIDDVTQIRGQRERAIGDFSGQTADVTFSRVYDLPRGEHTFGRRANCQSGVVFSTTWLTTSTRARPRARSAAGHPRCGMAGGNLADDGWSQESVALVVAHHFCLPMPREWRPLPRFPRKVSPSLVSFYASHRQSDGG